MDKEWGGKKAIHALSNQSNQLWSASMSRGLMFQMNTRHLRVVPRPSGCTFFLRETYKITHITHCGRISVSITPLRVKTLNSFCFSIEMGFQNKLHTLQHEVAFRVNTFRWLRVEVWQFIHDPAVWRVLYFQDMHSRRDAMIWFTQGVGYN